MKMTKEEAEIECKRLLELGGSNFNFQEYEKLAAIAGHHDKYNKLFKAFRPADPDEEQKP